MQNSLFVKSNQQQPLAHALRPKKIEDVVGPVTKNPSFINWLRAGAKQSAILWGPPGTGKTSIAQLAAEMESNEAELFQREFIKIHAFDAGVKDLREIIKKAKAFPGQIVLFVDEVHNFNKSQQDILLDAVETGILTLIGATTENPAVSVNRALLSRMLNFELKAHRYADLKDLLDKAIALKEKTLSAEAADYLIKSSYGDARHLLTNYEMLCNSFIDSAEISIEQVQSVASKKHFSGDANTYYDCVSALQKSMRGSDADAAIYWLARLLHAGAEIEQVARRILVTASEDVGLADPQALVLAEAAYGAAIRLGMPEARIPLAQAVAYIAKAPKSNESYKAIAKAMQDCENFPPYEVPSHLRGIAVRECPAKSNNVAENPITKYKYPHDYPGSYVEQQYMPDEMQQRKYF